ncbi:hypothetical protein GPUN_2475 [Glaciecola punicea ACAM 611]|uniref:Uncharacterized protein n=1 Tax=Glaciecola punicea ACAM 611 TaxID=1121923 RepID=H5TE63_9ALTE|nr:hypothetical protein GPUN_2475 [Glaciecola punicea ACAM 611]
MIDLYEIYTSVSKDRLYNAGLRVLKPALASQFAPNMAQIV